MKYMTRTTSYNDVNYSFGEFETYILDLEIEFRFPMLTFILFKPTLSNIIAAVGTSVPSRKFMSKNFSLYD